jgi:WD40 repeat protein
LYHTCCKAHTQDVNSVMWNPSVQGFLASASDDAEVKLWQFTE